MANESIGFRSLVEQIQQRDQETDAVETPRGRPQRSRARAQAAAAEPAAAPRATDDAPSPLLSRRWL